MERRVRRNFKTCCYVVGVPFCSGDREAWLPNAKCRLLILREGTCAHMEGMEGRRCGAGDFGSKSFFAESPRCRFFGKGLGLTRVKAKRILKHIGPCSRVVCFGFWHILPWSRAVEPIKTFTTPALHCALMFTFLPLELFFIVAPSCRLCLL